MLPERSRVVAAHLPEQPAGVQPVLRSESDVAQDRREFARQLAARQVALHEVERLAGLIHGHRAHRSEAWIV